LAAYRPLYRLRPSLVGSPIHADRIEFTATVLADGLCYGLVVLVPVLSTPPHGDAVPVQYHTALHRTGADFHRSDFPPSQAHERRHLAGPLPSPPPSPSPHRRPPGSAGILPALFRHPLIPPRLAGADAGAPREPGTPEFQP